jgi:mannan endo-1,4-beta-mannosidase
MRRAGVVAAAAVVVLALVGYTVYAGSRGERHEATTAAPSATTPATPSASPSPRTPPSPFPPAGKVFVGVQTGQGPYDMSDLDAFTRVTGHQPAVLQFTQSWANETFNREAFDLIADRRMLPLLSWEPWDYKVTGPARDSGAQPRYRLSRITGGAFDDYIRSWARGIKDLGYPVAVRFGHEMNGFWYPWCEQSNGNHRGDYVRAYRHVHQVFADEGATNVIWVWSPNVTYPGAAPLRRLYPGDRYVDWVGLSGYYGTAGVRAYRSFNQIFAGTFAELRTFTRKPIVITETGATDATGRRARWVRQMFAQLPQHPDVIGVIWFEVRKELDWRLSSTPAAARAFGAAAATARYQVTWSTNTIPRKSVTIPDRG